MAGDGLKITAPLLVTVKKQLLILFVEISLERLNAYHKYTHESIQEGSLSFGKLLESSKRQIYFGEEGRL